MGSELQGCWRAARACALRAAAARFPHERWQFVRTSSIPRVRGATRLYPGRSSPALPGCHFDATAAAAHGVLTNCFVHVSTGHFIRSMCFLLRFGRIGIRTVLDRCRWLPERPLCFRAGCVVLEMFLCLFSFCEMFICVSVWFDAWCCHLVIYVWVSLCDYIIIFVFKIIMIIIR